MEIKSGLYADTAFCLLPSAYCLLPTAFCLLPTAFCLLPTAYCLLLSSFLPHPCAIRVIIKFDVRSAVIDALSRSFSSR